jgi:hypothetical protein
MSQARAAHSRIDPNPETRESHRSDLDLHLGSVGRNPDGYLGAYEFLNTPNELAEMMDRGNRFGSTPKK